MNIYECSWIIMNHSWHDAEKSPWSKQSQNPQVDVTTSDPSGQATSETVQALGRWMFPRIYLLKLLTYLTCRMNLSEYVWTVMRCACWLWAFLHSKDQPDSHLAAPNRLQPLLKTRRTRRPWWKQKLDLDDLATSSCSFSVLICKCLHAFMFHVLMEMAVFE